MFTEKILFGIEDCILVLARVFHVMNNIAEGSDGFNRHIYYTADNERSNLQIIYTVLTANSKVLTTYATKKSRHEYRRQKSKLNLIFSCRGKLQD